MTTRGLCIAILLVPSMYFIAQPAQAGQKGQSVRLCAAQPRARLIDYKLSPAEALAEVDRTIAELETLVHQAGRPAGDAWNSQTDMRARLFRERTPAAYGILTDPNPPALRKIPEEISFQEAVRIAEGAMTAGGERFAAAEALLREGKTEQAVQAFEKLRSEYPNTWIDRAARAQLAKLRP